MARGTTSATLEKLLKRAEKITLADIINSKKKAPTEVTELVATILANGIRANASAVHIEPRGDGVHIRHRIDGVLTDAQILPKAIGPVLVAGLKLLVHLPVDEDETLPQQASLTINVQSKPYKLRVATVPIEDGEKAVVQLTSLSGKAPSLEQLGYWGPSLKALGEAMTRTKGVILLAGPHDSGQAETMYSILSQLNTPEVSVATIEDPILYRIPNTTQVQINARAGLGFVAGLKTLLRQDANVLMISNIRDAETAELSIEAALSGRLLIAGLHAPNTTAALEYLLASRVEPYLVAHTVQAVVAQRIVRRLCENCKEIYTPDEPEMIHILKTLGIKTAAQLQRIRDLEQQALQEKLVVGASPATDKGFIGSLYRPSKQGCAECSHTGYKGTIGIHEVLPISDAVQSLLVGHSSSDVIAAQAAQEGNPSLQMDGLVKIILGMTSVDEVVNATRP